MDRLRRARRDESGSEITGRVGQRRGFAQRPHGERFRAELFAPNVAFGVRAFDREDPRYFRKQTGTA